MHYDTKEREFLLSSASFTSVFLAVSIIMLLSVLTYEREKRRIAGKIIKYYVIMDCFSHRFLLTQAKMK